jgi:electron transport complex protein RnfD
MKGNFRVSSSPHIVSPRNTSQIMRDVLIALLPAAAVGVYMFGIKAFYVLAASTLAAVVTEYLVLKIFKRSGRVGDLSAAVTGLLIGMNMPSTAPVWVAIFGSMFAIIVVKQAFGGLGQNFMNPALAGRAFLVACWPARMLGSAFEPARVISQVATAASTVDATAYATPLVYLKQGTLALPQSLPSLFLGNVGGCIGDVSSIALLIGGIYLLARRIITWRIPTIYIGTVFIGSFLLGGFDVMTSLAHVLAGGLLLGAFFMATDYTTSPMSKKGHLIFAFGCGVLTIIIRMYGGYPEGVSYAILLMNIAAPLIDRYTRPKVFGEVKKNA